MQTDVMIRSIMLMFIKMLQTFISFGELLYGTTAEDVLIK